MIARSKLQNVLPVAEFDKGARREEKGVCVCVCVLGVGWGWGRKRETEMKRRRESLSLVLMSR